MENIIILFENSIDTIDVEKTSVPKELLARKLATKIVICRESGIPLQFNSRTPYSKESFSCFITGTLNPLPDELNLINDARLIISGLLSETLFQGKLNTKNIEAKLDELYKEYEDLFQVRDDFNHIICWQFGCIIKIFTENIDDIKKHATLLIEKGYAVFKDAMSKELVAPSNYCL